MLRAFIDVEAMEARRFERVGPLHEMLRASASSGDMEG